MVPYYCCICIALPAHQWFEIMLHTCSCWWGLSWTRRFINDLVKYILHFHLLDCVDLRAHLGVPIFVLWLPFTSMAHFMTYLLLWTEFCTFLCSTPGSDSKRWEVGMIDQWQNEIKSFYYSPWTNHLCRGPFMQNGTRHAMLDLYSSLYE